MGIFDFLKGQKIDVIRWENPSSDLLIKKWEHNLDEIKNKSSLIVDPNLSAIFVKNGKIEAIQKESGKWSLETENIPFITSLKNILSGFESHDKSSIYFLKLNEITNQKWGTPNSVTYVDSQYNFPVELRAFGNFSFRIVDIENFWLNYVANKNEVLVDDIRMIITDRIIGNIATAFAKRKASYNDIDSQTLEISQELKELTKEDFLKLGLELSDFRIEDINFTEKTQNFIDKIISKKADIGAINVTSDIDKNAMENYKELENLSIMKDAANNSGSSSDGIGAGIGIAIGANMMQNIQKETPEIKEDNYETKLLKIKDLFDKGLISKEEYEEKKKEILSKI